MKHNLPFVTVTNSNMKYWLTIMLAIATTAIAWAQPANDECANLIDFGTAPSCQPTIYTNVDATDSSTGVTDSPTCFNGGTTQNDVFFSFMVDPALVNVTITIQGSTQGPNGISIVNPQVAVYRGSCAGLAELGCASSPIGSTSVELDMLGLTPGIPYFIRINDYSNSATPNWGDFTVCIEEYIPAINIGTDPNTSACSGTLYDSGGPDADYGNNENHTFTICPQDFSQCIALDVTFFGTEVGDQITVFAGATTAGTEIADLTGVSTSSFQILVPDGCATVQFVSDANVVGAGFEINWQCSPIACSSDFDNPTVIPSIPYSNPSLTTCGADANFNQTPCVNETFLNGPETVFLFQPQFDICASVQVSNAAQGTGVLILTGIPGDPATVCLAQSNTGVIPTASFDGGTDYYIVVANSQGCTDFGLSLQEAECVLNPGIVNALCNPLNYCVDANSLTSQLTFADGFQDVPMEIGLNAGCWVGVGAQSDFVWFTIQAQADGAFGFILESGNNPSDIDINVWGPFTPSEVCETPQDVIDFVTNNQPIRSTWTGGNQSTGLADIHPETGIAVIDEFDCGSPATPGAGGDRFVRTIDVMEGEVYLVLANDFGNVIENGEILIDWGPSDAIILLPDSPTVAVNDTSVCAGQSVQVVLETSSPTDIQWINNLDELSCDDCLDP
ncbi:MAG: hypothetical protein R2795_25755 [Saprospiraceae bacterium]